jgi:hypothetical protein
MKTVLFLFYRFFLKQVLQNGILIELSEVKMGPLAEFTVQGPLFCGHAAITAN